VKQAALKSFFIILAVALFSCQQKNNSQNMSEKSVDKPFYLTYTYAELGSNIGKKEPTVRISGTRLIYTYEQNSSWDGKILKEDVDTILVGAFRETSIDSIKNILVNLKDTTIFQTNPCIISGGIHYLTVAFGTDTTKFELMNTFDYTALLITNLLNQYLPVEKKLWADEQLIKDEKGCWTWRHKQQDNDNKN
jgi:hypothetical protein